MRHAFVDTFHCVQRYHKGYLEWLLLLENISGEDNSLGYSSILPCIWAVCAVWDSTLFLPRLQWDEGTKQEHHQRGIEGASSWVDSLKIDPDSSTTIRINLVPLHQVERKTHLKTTFCLYIVRAGKAKTEGASTYEMMKPKTLKRAATTISLVLNQTSMLLACHSVACETQLSEGLSGLSPHPQSHSCLWYLASGTFVK